MPPKKTPPTEADAPTHGYTEGEIQLAFAMIKRLPRPTAYDADAIATEIGSASGSSVRKRVSLAMAKHGWFSGAAPAPAEGAENGSPAVTPKTPRAKKTPTTGGRKKKKLQDTEDGDDEQEHDTPAKKKPRANARKAKSEEAVEQAVDDAESCAKTEEALKATKAEEEGAASEELEGQI